MRAIVVEAFGGPDELRLRDIPRPSPGPGEVLVAVEVAGVNYIDVYMRNGTYGKSDTYKTPLPMTLGMEASGTIASVGAGVTQWRPGDRVAYCLARGSYAEFAVVPAWRVVHLPDDITPETGAALMLQGMTAHYLSHSAFALKPGDACLIHAAAGGVGQLLTQIAKSRGATVIGTVGTAAKGRIAQARGCDHVILYRDTDFREAVMQITAGRGVDVVYDSVGKDTIGRSVRCLRKRGLCVLFGASSGPVSAITPLELAEAGSVFFTRPHLADYLGDHAEIDQRAQALFRLHAEGRLEATVHDTLPLEEAAAAHRMLESRETLGKILLELKA